MGCPFFESTFALMFLYFVGCPFLKVSPFLWGTATAATNHGVPFFLVCICSYVFIFRGVPFFESVFEGARQGTEKEDSKID